MFTLLQKIKTDFEVSLMWVEEDVESD